MASLSCAEVGTTQPKLVPPYFLHNKLPFDKEEDFETKSDIYMTLKKQVSQMRSWPLNNKILKQKIPMPLSHYTLTMRATMTVSFLSLSSPLDNMFWVDTLVACRA